MQAVASIGHERLCELRRLRFRSSALRLGIFQTQALATCEAQ